MWAPGNQRRILILIKGGREVVPGIGRGSAVRKTLTIKGTKVHELNRGESKNHALRIMLVPWECDIRLGHGIGTRSSMVGDCAAEVG